MASFGYAEKINECPQRRPHLSPGRIINIKSIKPGAPFFHYCHQTSFLQILPDHILKKKSQANSGERRLPDMLLLRKDKVTPHQQ
nr:hypothetical protein [Mixta theicola]